MPVGQQSGREKEREWGTMEKKSKMRQHLNIAQDCPLPPQRCRRWLSASVLTRIRAFSNGFNFLPLRTALAKMLHARGERERAVGGEGVADYTQSYLDASHVTYAQ